jgi:hypothetical protein
VNGQRFLDRVMNNPALRGKPRSKAEVPSSERAADGGALVEEEPTEGSGEEPRP